MGIKDKKQQMIKEILERAGALDSAAIKERVCARLGIDVESYPKPSYLRHLKELVDDNEIILDSSSGKNIYSLGYDGSNVIGHKYLEQLGGRIHVPQIVNTAGVKIVHGIREFDNQDEVFIVCDIKDNFFTISVHRDAFPFHVHLSRIQEEKDKVEKITSLHGKRTIVLETPIPRVSGYNGEERSGHLILTFLSTGGVEVRDLNSSNGTILQAIDSSMTESILSQAAILSKATIQTSWMNKSETKEREWVKLAPNDPKVFSLPVALSCSNDMRLILFG